MIGSSAESLTSYILTFRCNVEEQHDAQPEKMRKFIVFESCLRALLAVCCICLSPCSVAIQHICGTSVVLKATCKEGHERLWYSQPMSGRMPKGNLLVAGSVLFSVCSPVKAINLLRNVNIATFTRRTYDRLQTSYLLPSITSVWQRMQDTLLEVASGKELTLGGDGRCCSPGHTAKYESYSLMDHTTSKVLHTELVQVHNSLCFEKEP